jgi:hypothetical protein
MSTIVFLPLSRGKVAIIDFDDFEKVGRKKWSAGERGNRTYAVRSSGPHKKRVCHYLHQEILETKGVDHLNGDGLNNCRNILRPLSQWENTRAFQHKRPGATSRFRGVSWCNRDEVWCARIKVAGLAINLGNFQNEIDAAKAYDQAATKFGFLPEALNFRWTY